MAKFEFESDEEMVDFEGIPMPKSTHEKLLETGRKQTTASMRRKAQDKLSGVLSDDVDWTKVNPGDIVDGMAEAFANKSKAMDELKNKPVDPLAKGKEDPKPDSSDEMRLLKDEMAAQTDKHKNELLSEKVRNLTSESKSEISRLLIGAGLNEDQHEFVHTMIDKCFGTKVEGDKVIFNQIGSDDDHYVDGNLANSKDIAGFIQKKYINSFSKVAAGGGTRRTIDGTTSQSLYDSVKGGSLKQIEKDTWK